MMLIRSACLAILTSATIGPPAAVAQVDEQRAQEFFREARALCERDAGWSPAVHAYRMTGPWGEQEADDGVLVSSDGRMLGGLGGFVGSVAGAFLGQTGLFVGGFLGGVLVAPLSAKLALWRSWIAPPQYWPTAIGAAAGFVAAAVVAVSTLSSPVGRVLSTLLVGLGALIGRRWGLTGTSAQS